MLTTLVQTRQSLNYLQPIYFINIHLSFVLVAVLVNVWKTITEISQLFNSFNFSKECSDTINFL